MLHLVIKFRDLAVGILISAHFALQANPLCERQTVDLSTKSRRGGGGCTLGSPPLGSVVPIHDGSYRDVIYFFLAVQISVGETYDLSTIRRILPFPGRSFSHKT